MLRRPVSGGYFVCFVAAVTAFVFYEGRTLGQYQVQVDPYQVQYSSPPGGARSADWDTYSFSRIFGVANATAVDASASVDQNAGNPPPAETWLLDPGSFTPDDPNVIPRVINKIFFQKSSGFPSAESMPVNLTMAHKSWHEMNPGYEVRYFDLERSRSYLRHHFHPVFLRAFDCLTAFAAKSDLFRMALLYREGGWHSDWKQVAMRRHALRNISSVTDIFAAYDLWDSSDYFPHKCVQNAFVGSRPRHPIIAKMLEYILIHVQTLHYSGGALDATATCIFGRAIHDSEAKRDSKWFAEVAGKFVATRECPGCYQWAGETIALHKCDNCGGGSQDWGETGNNYILLFKQRNYYCEDAASLFRTT